MSTTTVSHDITTGPARRPLLLQLNNSGTWKTLAHFDAGHDEACDKARAAGQLLGELGDERVTLRSHGKTTVVGGFLSVQAQADLADTLRAAINRIKSQTRTLVNGGDSNAVYPAPSEDAFDKDGILEYFGSEPPAGIAGFDNLKRWIRDRKNAFFNPGPLPPTCGFGSGRMPGVRRAASISIASTWRHGVS